MGPPGASSFRVAGRYLGYETEWCNDFDTWFGLAVMDLSAGKWTRDVWVMPNHPNEDVLRSWVLTNRGSLGFAAATQIRRGEVWRRVAKADGPRPRRFTVLDGLPYPEPESGPVDTGDGIDARSLRLTGAMLTWMRHGQQRSAPIR